MVSWGLLSTARINRHIITGARASSNAEVVAVASRDPERAEAYAREHGIERAYGSYEELLADPDLEAIYISLPNSMHVDWSIRALEAGKHVLCEKPLARRPEDAERAFDAAERAGRLLMEGFMYRHHPQTIRVAELVREGAIGALRVVRAAFSFPLDDLENVRMRPELDGGSLMDVGCYCVSGSRLLAGEPEQALGRQVIGPTGVDVTFAGTLRFPGDVLAQFQCSFAVPFRQELEAIGSEGSLLVEAPWRPDLGGSVFLKRDDRVELVPVEKVDMYRLQIENLSAAIRGEAEPFLGREDAVAQARALDALYRSAGGGAAPLTE